MIKAWTERANRAKWNLTKEEVKKLYEYFYPR